MKNDKEFNVKKDKALLSLIERANINSPDSYNYAIPKVFSRKATSFMLIREDIRYVKSITTKLINAKQSEVSDEEINSALWYAVLAIYGKCYTENDGGMSKLEADIFPAESEFLEIHETLMRLRHSFVAHRDDNEYEQAILYMKIPKNDKLADKTEYKISSQKILSPKPEQLENYITLFDFIIAEVEKKVAKHTQKAHDALFKHLTPKQISFLLIPDKDVEL